MLSVKPWKTEAMLRLLASVFVCLYAGSLLLLTLHHDDKARVGTGFYLLLVGALGCSAAALVCLHRPWTLERIMRHLAAFLIFFYGGLLLGAFAQKLAGSPGPSVAQMVIGAVSFQGAVVLLAGRFVREHQVTWSEAFGFGNRRRLAIVLGFCLACGFVWLGTALQAVSVAAMEAASKRLPGLHLKPEAQQAVQTLQATTGWGARLLLGVVTILLAPMGEEILFRGLLYPWIKQAGYPRLALWGTVALFALIHLNLETFLPLAVLALALTMLYEWTDNLLAPVAAHALFNALNFARALT